MDVRKIFLDNLQAERRITRETIAAMADGDMQFKPTEDQMAFGAHALHLISAHETLLDGLHGKGWNWDRGIDLERYPTQEAILAKLDELGAAELACYGSMEEEQLGRMIPITWGSPEPALQLMISFLTHECHHRGTMVAYLRLKGMKPAPY